MVENEVSTLWSSGSRLSLSCQPQWSKQARCWLGLVALESSDPVQVLTRHWHCRLPLSLQALQGTYWLEGAILGPVIP